MKSSDIFDIKTSEEFTDEDFDFGGMDFSDMGEDDASKLIFLPVHASIDPESQVGLLSNSFVITKGSWKEVSKFISDNWSRLNGKYEIVDSEGGGTLHTFTVAR